MKKWAVIIVSLFPSLAFAQMAWMDEAHEDAANSEPLSVSGIVAFLVLVGLVYVVVKIVEGEKHNSEKRKRAAETKEVDRKYATIKAGGFICPFCGKHVVDNNYQIMIRYYDNEKYKVKSCKTCAERYDQYLNESLRFRRKNDDLPRWLEIIYMVLIFGSGLYALIYNCIKGDVFDGILGMFFVPLAVFFILGVPIAIFSKIIEKPEPTEPFKTPTLQHIRDCNAIHMTFDDYKRAIEKELNKRNYNQVENKKLMSESEHIITECFEKKQSITLAVLALEYGYSK